MSSSVVSVKETPLEDAEKEEEVFEEEDEEEEEEDDYYYYSFDEDANNEGGQSLNNNQDPEHSPHDCLNSKEVATFLQEAVEAVCTQAKVRESSAKLVLHQNAWSVEKALLAFSKSVVPAAPGCDSHSPKVSLSCEKQCEVCAALVERDRFAALDCGHWFCTSCWEIYLENQIARGSSTSLTCMSTNCDMVVTESFVLSHVSNSAISSRYLSSAFQDYVRSHPLLRFCPGQNCKSIIKSLKPSAKRCCCTQCKLIFCFQCGSEYHAPTDCDTIRLWLTKCADDSETANYISAHTKDCPKCNICIEKNGGCNHMQCYNCKHDFCWMCLGDWKTHGSEYYECSRYKENPNIAHESAHAQAREALKKYLHYFERWENHSKSMKLEAQTMEKIKNRINDKVMEGSGTWIDWQYLLDASTLLAKCRYTLQYTYPFAYYMPPGSKKELVSLDDPAKACLLSNFMAGEGAEQLLERCIAALTASLKSSYSSHFEYQQAQLEAEIENLSWKIERAESTDRGELENQIDIAEKRRTSLLKDFLPS